MAVPPHVWLAHYCRPGKTLVLSGVDLSAVGRGEYGTKVWRSSDDGDSWTDETGDLVTISPGPGVWYENDFYFVTRGEGVTVKRDFEAAAAAAAAAAAPPPAVVEQA